MKIKKSNVDLYLYYNWIENGPATTVSWINDNSIVRNEKVAVETKKNLMDHFGGQTKEN